MRVRNNFQVVDDFVDDLTEEILQQAAGTFFTGRVLIDKEIEEFLRQAAKLTGLMKRTLGIASTLHELVLEPKSFYETLGIEPKGLLANFISEKQAVQLHPPFHFTLKGKYISLVTMIYEKVADYADKYNNGEKYRDPKTKEIVKTVHYQQLLEWHEELNGLIKDQNKNLPSYSLRLSKSLNSSLCEKERVMRVCERTAGTNLIDKKLALKELDFTLTGLVEIPVLPRVTKVKRKLNSFLKQMYYHNKDSICPLINAQCWSLTINGNAEWNEMSIKAVSRKSRG